MNSFTHKITEIYNYEMKNTIALSIETTNMRIKSPCKYLLTSFNNILVVCRQLIQIIRISDKNMKTMQ